MNKEKRNDMSDINENGLVSVAMQIILHAGDARNSAMEALNAVKKEDFKLAKEKIAEAKKSIVLAHNSQTEVIRNEVSGIKYEPCLLFTHAQDTLMTINSEIILAENIVDLFETYDKKLKQK